jgi:hypothetical protein
MVKRESMDYWIRETLHQDVSEQEPSADVRDSLLARAEAHTADTEQVVGSAIPPLVNGLRDASAMSSSLVRLPEVEAELTDLFGSAQQRLVAVWQLSINARY